VPRGRGQRGETELGKDPLETSLDVGVQWMRTAESFIAQAVDERLPQRAAVADHHAESVRAPEQRQFEARFHALIDEAHGKRRY